MWKLILFFILLLFELALIVFAIIRIYKNTKTPQYNYALMVGQFALAVMSALALTTGGGNKISYGLAIITIVMALLQGLEKAREIKENRNEKKTD